MAVAYLAEDASSLAAANWSDTTGFADGATLVIQKGGKSIQDGLSQAAADIEYLDILPGFTGSIGGTGGSLTCDADGTAESAATLVSRIRYQAAGGHLYFNAGGANTLAHQVVIGNPPRSGVGSGSFFGTGGILKNVQLLGGRATFSDAVLATGGVWNFAGGSSTTAYHATNDLPSVRVSGGTHLLQRNCTALVVAGGDVTLDCQGLTPGTITVYAGRFTLLNSGTITALLHLGGTLNFGRLGRPVTITTGTAVGDDVVTSPLVTVTNYAYPVGKKWN